MINQTIAGSIQKETAQKVDNLRKKLGEVLVEMGLVTERQIKQALDVQARQSGSRKRLGAILVDLNHISEEQLADSLAEKFMFQRIDLSSCTISREAAGVVTRELALKYGLLPITIDQKCVTIAMADPLNYKAREWIALKTGLVPTVVVTTETDLAEAIEKTFLCEDTSQYAASEILRLNQAALEDVSIVSEREEDRENAESLFKKSSEAPIVRLVAAVIVEAMNRRASDVHFEPMENQCRVRLRVDGEMKTLFRYERNIHAAVASRIKILSKLDITNRRTPQDGCARMISGNQEADLRVSLMPGIYGEKAVIRVLVNRGELLSLSALGMPPELTKNMHEVLSRPQGMVLVTGPTGSGKTTTLYASIRHLLSDKRNIVTIEDPVEYKISGITQVQVNDAVGRTFAVVLRSVLRQDPDIIKIGEIRDLETAEIATKAALTGHLVLSTIHTTGTISTITRLVDLGLSPYIVSSVIDIILAQRLIRIICGNCKTDIKVDDQYRSILDQYALELPDRLWVGTGCDLCDHTGYGGRRAVYEGLVMTGELKSMVAAGEAEESIIQHMKRAGMPFFPQRVWDLVTAGQTTVTEFLTKIPLETIRRNTAQLAVV